MKFVRDYIFLIVVFSLCLVIFLDFAPSVLSWDLVFARLTGYLEMPTSEFVVTAFEDFVLPTFKKLGVGIGNIFKPVLEEISDNISKVLETFDTFKGFITSKLNDFYKIFSSFGSLFGGNK